MTNLNNVVWHPMHGNSMKPMICNGDQILLQEIKDWKDFLPKGEVYALQLANGIDTVRIVRKGSDDQHLKLVPVNTQDYDEDEIPVTAISCVFKVVATVNRF